MLHIAIIKYIFEIYLDIIYIAGDRKEYNMKGLKTIQLSTVVETLYISTLLDTC